MSLSEKKRKQYRPVMKKTILITGATSGIGEATAIRFAQEGHRLILTGRRAERLAKLASSLRQNYNCEVLPMAFDVRDKDRVHHTLSSLAINGEVIDVLINNAGLASGLSPIQNGDLDDWDVMIDTNIKGLLYVTRVIAPMMVKQGFGHIINVCSIAGVQNYPNGNVYCATKHAVSSLTETMRMDLNASGIKVSQVLPGAVETEFSLVRFKGDEDRAQKVYEGFEPLSGADVADAIHYMVQAPAHVNISDLMILPAAQASSTIFKRKQ